ncbi:MAG: hypothetical protein N2112_05675 [Gemmataceae bacterium]|nr:hypothetical protein [Gemmataceae bacterium]
MPDSPSIDQNPIGKITINKKPIRKDSINQKLFAELEPEASFCVPS